MEIFAHIFTAERCPATWANFPGSVPWPPNEIIEEHRLIQDWRGRSVFDENFSPVTMNNGEAMRLFGAPLLHVSPIETSNKVKVEAAFYPLCPFQELRRGTMFTSKEDITSNCIGQAVISILRGHLERTLTVEVVKSVFKYASEGDVLKSRLKHQCKQVISTRKKYAKEVYFSQLGYASTLAVRSKRVTEHL